MSSNDDDDHSLDGSLRRILSRRKSHNKLRSLRVTPRGMVDFSSNGYLSISSNLEVQRAYLSRLQHEVAAAEHSRGSSEGTCTPPPRLLGSEGSRLLDGNTSFAESLERRIAAHHDAPSALLFVSAFDANVGLLSCVPQSNDVILYDELIHASVHDGMRLSRAGRRLSFAHASVTEAGAIGKPGGLGHVLSQLVDSDADASGEIKNGKRNVFICVESLYSMDGDVLLLDSVVECMDKYLPCKNGYIVLDEAHSTGIFGDGGRGLAHDLGLQDRVWARVLGLGKAMGCSGGVVLCTETTRSYLVNYARSLIYTTSAPFTSLLSIDIVYDYIASAKADIRREHLRNLIRYAHLSLLNSCARQLPSSERLITVAEHPPSSPIIPVLTAHPRSLAEHCQRNGYMVRPIVPPTVPPGKERVRICLHADNTTSQVDGLCKVIDEWLRSRQESKEDQTNHISHTQVVDITKAKI